VKKAARLVALVACGIYVVYLIAVNAALRFGGVEHFVNDSTDAAHLELGSSYSWLPGRVDVRDIALRFEDVNVQFELRIEHAKGTLSLLDLARKRLHFSRLDADGVRFRFRHKVTRVAGNERRLVHFPRIEGFADPPILVPEPPADKTKNWGIELENVTARGVELWFMEYRYTGRADVTGGFLLEPGRRLRVGPAHLALNAGELAIGAKRPLARHVNGTFDFRFREANPDPLVGLTIFRQISSKLALDAELVDLEAANLYLSDASLVAVRRGAGTLAARLELVDGRFLPGSFAAVRPGEDLHVVLSNAALSGRFTAEARATSRDGAPPALAVTSSLEQVKLRLRTAQPAEPEQKGDVAAGALEAALATDNADVTRPWLLEEAQVGVDAGRVEDVSTLDAPARDGSVLEGGSGWFFGRAELERGGAWTGAVRADARGVRVRVGERRSTLDATFAAALESPRRDLDVGAVRDVTLDVTGRSDADSESPIAVKLRVARAEWQRFPPSTVRGRATLAAPRIEPVFEALGAPGILVSVWPDAPVEASARFAVVDDALDIRLDLARSGPFRATGRLRVCSPPKGAFLVKSGAFSAGLSVRDGEMRVVPLAGDRWLEENAPACPSVE
jgi:hypothetical protein